YWQEQARAPDIDRAPVAARLKSLIALDKEFDTDFNKAFLKSLELALAPSTAKPGSVKALIDDLVNFSSDLRSMAQEEPEERYWRIVRRGFDAVPDLIGHLDDER